MRGDGTLEEHWEGAAEEHVELGGVRQFRCPRRPLLDEPNYYARVMLAYQHYQNGYLPDPGSISEQSNKLMQLITLMSTVVAECQEVKDRKRPRPKGPSQSGSQGRKLRRKMGG